MSMDKRQTQIREQAGLTESRLNLEFVDFIKEWGGRLGMVLVIASLAWFAWTRWTQHKTGKVNEAFAQLSAVSAATNANPEALKRIADEYDDVRGVSSMARIYAADAYLRAVRGGMVTGADLAPDGTLVKPEDALTADGRATYLAEAESLYQTVVTELTGVPEKTLLRLNALFGLAAVNESRGELDKAKARYEEIVAAADKTTFQSHADIAKDRLTTISKFAEAPMLFTKAELPPLPTPPPIVPDPVTVPGPTVLPDAPVDPTQGPPAPGKLDVGPATLTPATPPATAPATPPVTPPATEPAPAEPKKQDETTPQEPKPDEPKKPADPK